MVKSKAVFVCYLTLTPFWTSSRAYRIHWRRNGTTTGSISSLEQVTSLSFTCGVCQSVRIFRLRLICPTRSVTKAGFTNHWLICSLYWTNGQLCHAVIWLARSFHQTEDRTSHSRETSLHRFDLRRRCVKRYMVTRSDRCLFFFCFFFQVHTKPRSVLSKTSYMPVRSGSTVIDINI